MGREARCPCRWPDGDGEVKALLESDVLVLRGALARTLKRSEISRARGLVDTKVASVSGTLTASRYHRSDR